VRGLGNFAGAVRYCSSAVAVSEEENKKIGYKLQPAARFRHRAVTMFLLQFSRFGRGEESFFERMADYRASACGSGKFCVM
jgi:hypothetical protein